MSVNGNVNAASTYQTVVIAIVAGGILATGALSILWKRRQARRWIAMRRNMPPGSLSTRGGGGREGESGLGAKPGIWDVSLGEGEKREGDVKELDGLDLDGKMKTGWKPASLSLSAIPPPATPPKSIANPSHSPSSHQAEITVLIAMPHFDHSFTPDQPSSSSEPVTRPSYDPPNYSPIYHYPMTSPPPINDYDDDEDGRPLPLLEMGLTSIPVSPASGSRAKSSVIGLEELIKKAATAREEASAGRRHRSRSTAWDGVPANTQPPGQMGGFQGTGVDPLTNPTAASRYAMIRNGALAGFGSPSGRQGVIPGNRA